MFSALLWFGLTPYVGKSHFPSYPHLDLPQLISLNQLSEKDIHTGV